MLTKGAIGNLINRYKAVLKKCNLINTFGSLAVASMLVMGGAGVAGATAGDFSYTTDGGPIYIDTEKTVYSNDKQSDGKKFNGDENITIEIGKSENLSNPIKFLPDASIVTNGDITLSSQDGLEFGEEDETSNNLISGNNITISGKLYNEDSLTINAGGNFTLTNSHLCGNDDGSFNITAVGDVSLSGDKKPVINTGAEITIAGNNVTINGTEVNFSTDDEDYGEVGWLNGRNVAIVTSVHEKSFTATEKLTINDDVLFFNGGELTLSAGGDVEIDGAIINTPSGLTTQPELEEGETLASGGSSFISGNNVTVTGDIWNGASDSETAMSISAVNKLSIYGNVNNQGVLNVSADSFTYGDGTGPIETGSFDLINTKSLTVDGADLNLKSCLANLNTITFTENEGAISVSGTGNEEVVAIYADSGTSTVISGKAVINVSGGEGHTRVLDARNGGSITTGSIAINATNQGKTVTHSVYALNGGSIAINGDVSIDSDDYAIDVYKNGTVTINDASNPTGTVTINADIHNGGEFEDMPSDGGTLSIAGKTIAITGDVRTVSGTTTLKAAETISVEGYLNTISNESWLEARAQDIAITNGGLTGNGNISITAQDSVEITGRVMTAEDLTQPELANNAKFFKAGNKYAVALMSEGGRQNVTGSTAISGSTIDITGGIVALEPNAITLTATGSTDNTVDITGDVLLFNDSSLNLSAGGDVKITGLITNRPEAVDAKEFADCGGSISISGNNVTLIGDIWNEKSYDPDVVMTIKAKDNLTIQGNLDNQSELNITADSFNYSGGYLNFDNTANTITVTNNATIGDGNVAPIVAAGDLDFRAGGTVVINGGKVTDTEITEYAPVVADRNLAIYGATLEKTGPTTQAFTANTLEVKGHIVATDRATVALTATGTGSFITGNILTTDTAKVTMDGAFKMDGIIEKDTTTDKYSNVIVKTGSLTVDASTLGSEGKASDTALGIINGLTVNSGATLTLDFANLKNADGSDFEYTQEQFDKAMEALLGNDAGAKLEFVNASIYKEPSKELVAGGGAVTNNNGKTEITVSTGPSLVDKGEIPSTGESVDTSLEDVIKIVDNTGTAPKVDEININTDMKTKTIVVGNENAAVHVAVNTGKNVTFAGAESVKDTLVKTEEGKAVKASFEVADGATLTFGHKDREKDQKATVATVELKGNGKHDVNGNGAHKTEFHYGELITNPDAQMNVLHAAVQIKNYKGNRGRMLIDPAYVGFESIEGNALNDQIIAGSGSVLNLGNMDINDLKDAVSAAGVGIKNATSTSFTVTDDSAVVALGRDVSLGTGSLKADATLNSSASSTDYADAGDAHFAGNSLFVVKAGAQLSGSGDLTVAEGAKLALVGAQAGQTYDVPVADFTNGLNGVANKAWGKTADASGEIATDSGTLIINGLLTAEWVKDSTGKYSIETGLSDLAAALPGVNIANTLTAMAVNGQINGDESAPASIKFLSRATDPLRVGSVADTGVKTINEVSSAAVTASVQNTALRVADAASNTVLGHMSLAQHDGSRAIHSGGVDFWAAPMYGNLYNSGMVVSGDSVRGQFGGLALGADLEGGSFLGGKLRVGAAINGGGGQSETSGTVTNTQNDYDFGGINVYAGWNKGAFNLVGSVGYGFGSNDVEMGLPSSIGMGTAKADIDTGAFTADLRAEYQLKTDWVDMLPHMGIRYTALKTDSYDLKVGGSKVNSVDSDTQHIVQFPIGVTFSKDFACSGWNVKPVADVSVIPASGDKDASTKVRYAGINASDSFDSRVMDSTSWAGTIGIQAEKGNFSLGLNYGVQASSHETDQNIQLKLGWKF